MKHAVKHILIGGMASLSREQSSRLRDATAREGCRMSSGKLDQGVTGR